MYRLLEDSGEPTKKQASGKRIRPRAALKRENRPEEPAIGTVARATGHDLLGGQWPARETQNATHWVAFCALSL